MSNSTPSSLPPELPDTPAGQPPTQNWPGYRITTISIPALGSGIGASPTSQGAKDLAMTLSDHTSKENDHRAAPGPAPACTDAELLTIALVRHLLGRRQSRQA